MASSSSGAGGADATAGGGAGVGANCEEEEESGVGSGAVSDPVVELEPVLGVFVGPPLASGEILSGESRSCLSLGSSRKGRRGSVELEPGT